MKTISTTSAVLLLLVVSTAQADVISGLTVHYEFENAGDFGENTVGEDGLADPSLVGDTGPGSLGQAADFGTVDDARFIDLAPLAGPGDGAFSFSTWLKTDSAIGVQTLLHGSGADSGDRVAVAMVDGQSTALLIDSGATPNTYVAALALDEADLLADSVWHHVAATWSGGDDDVLRLYVDGELAAVETESLGNFEIDAWAIGSQISGTASFAGSLDDLRIYDRALDDGGTLIGQAAGGDIAELYAIGEPVPEPGTLVLLVSAIAVFLGVAKWRKRQ